MAINIISIGHKMPSWIDEGCADYAKRFPPEFKIQLIELLPEKRPLDTAALKKIETEKCFKKTKDSHTVIALDETGLSLDTLKFTDQFRAWQNTSTHMDFLIGGADGFDKTMMREKADEIISLSPLTLAHGLVRIVLLEQLYRAITLMKGHPYHRA